jgi:paraquat-inducible protein A
MSRRMASLALLLSGAAYLVGVAIPVMSIKTGVLWISGTRTYSVLSSIVALFRSGDLGLGAILVACCVLFPLVKYVCLGLALSSSEDLGSRRSHRVVAALGRWSMLDVFIVALLIVLVKTDSFWFVVESRPEPGVFVYGFSVISAMALSRFVYAAGGRRRDRG